MTHLVVAQYDGKSPRKKYERALLSSVPRLAKTPAKRFAGHLYEYGELAVFVGDEDECRQVSSSLKQANVFARVEAVSTDHFLLHEMTNVINGKTLAVKDVPRSANIIAEGFGNVWLFIRQLCFFGGVMLGIVFLIPFIAFLMSLFIRR